MKIGILTQPLHTNYGGLLQNYALQQVLKGMGHEVETIDHGFNKKKSITLKRYILQILSKIKTILLHIFFPTRLQKVRYLPNDEELSEIRKKTDHFINKYISHTPPLLTTKDFDELSNGLNYNAYVVGSDQCWRPIYNGNILPEMFLRFAEKQRGVKRIAYAASFGTSVWEYTPEETDICSQLAEKFDLITVREKSGVALCDNYLGVKAVQVLDPTMLLSKEAYEDLVLKENEPKSNGDLFYYILDPSEEKKKIIERIASDNGYTPFTTLPKCQEENRTKEDVKERIDDCVYPSVTSWLRSFMDAKMVIVDSFHGAVFSIIFNKPFWIIGNSERGNARFDSLLELFGLKERMISIDGIKLEAGFDWCREIDWGRVNEIRENEKQRCITLLENYFK